jgi:ubiquinone/menaquinone biosynthesis C-methylase UbiE
MSEWHSRMSAGGHADRGFHAPTGRAMDIDAYDRYVGRWSRLFVPALLAAAMTRVGDRVLDVAVGPGAAAAEALSVVSPSGLVVGADISFPMVAGARARLSGPFRGVVADGQPLRFRDGGFDAVICQLGLMFFPDPALGLLEFRRVLRPGRSAAVCVISTPESAPMWGLLADALGRCLPDHRDALHLSFSLADAGRLEAMLWAAGFAEVSLTRERRGGVISSVDEFWASIEAGTGQLPQAYLALSDAARRAVCDEVNAGLAQFAADGRLSLSVEMLIAAGRA